MGTMDLSGRVKYILSSSHLKQKELASILEVSPSYVSGLCAGRNKGISSSMAERVENRLGYSAIWLLDGTGNVMATKSKAPGLSLTHQRAIAQIERLTEAQAKAVLAFIRTLIEIERETAD